MLSEDHEYKIRKYTNRLKTSTGNRSEYYQRKLRHYHQMHQMGGYGGYLDSVSPVVEFNNMDYLMAGGAIGGAIELDQFKKELESNRDDIMQIITDKFSKSMQDLDSHDPSAIQNAIKTVRELKDMVKKLNDQNKNKDLILSQNQGQVALMTKDLYESKLKEEICKSNLEKANINMELAKSQVNVASDRSDEYITATRQSNKQLESTVEDFFKGVSNEPSNAPLKPTAPQKPPAPLVSPALTQAGGAGETSELGDLYMALTEELENIPIVTNGPPPPQLKFNETLEVLDVVRSIASLGNFLPPIGQDMQEKTQLKVITEIQKIGKQLSNQKDKLRKLSDNGYNKLIFQEVVNQVKNEYKKAGLTLDVAQIETIILGKTQ
jgi:hypothetical protein